MINVDTYHVTLVRQSITKGVLPMIFYTLKIRVQVFADASVLTLITPLIADIF
jgi:hypothetical protein